MTVENIDPTSVTRGLQFAQGSRSYTEREFLIQFSGDGLTRSSPTFIFVIRLVPPVIYNKTASSLFRYPAA